MESTIEVGLETGEMRTFAAAVHWPGWCRSGRGEAAALQALVDYGPRYASVLQGTSLRFQAPSGPALLVVVERLHGSTTADFGVPDRVFKRNSTALSPTELNDYSALLRACWRAFDSAVEAAAGKTLRTGPRGGGRNLMKISQHVQDVDAAYLGNLGVKWTPDTLAPDEALAHLRETILTSLRAAASGELPTQGPRGGVRWSPRYFVHRLAWHELDHAWEIEDRAG